MPIPTPPMPPVQHPPTQPSHPTNPNPQPPVYIPVPGHSGGTAADLKAESTSNNSSRSKSDSSSVNSATQSNVMINNSSNLVQIDGIQIPSTTIQLNGYYNNNGYNDDFGVVLGISASLDGKSRANTMLDKRIRLTQLQYERELAGACASIKKDNFRVNPNSLIATELAQCDNIITQVNVEVANPAPDNSLEELRRENLELKRQLQLILQKLDTPSTPVRGGF